jgi:hypothetical protein
MILPGHRVARTNRSIAVTRKVLLREPMEFPDRGLAHRCVGESSTDNSVGSRILAAAGDGQTCNGASERMLAMRLDAWMTYWSAWPGNRVAGEKRR